MSDMFVVRSVVVRLVINAEFLIEVGTKLFKFIFYSHTLLPLRFSTFCTLHIVRSHKHSFVWQTVRAIQHSSFEYTKQMSYFVHFLLFLILLFIFTTGRSLVIYCTISVQHSTIHTHSDNYTDTPLKSMHSRNIRHFTFGCEQIIYFFMGTGNKGSLCD